MCPVCWTASGRMISLRGLLWQSLVTGWTLPTWLWSKRRSSGTLTYQDFDVARTRLKKRDIVDTMGLHSLKCPVRTTGMRFKDIIKMIQAMKNNNMVEKYETIQTVVLVSQSLRAKMQKNELWYMKLRYYQLMTMMAECWYHGFSMKGLKGLTQVNLWMWFSLRKKWELEGTDFEKWQWQQWMLEISIVQKRLKEWKIGWLFCERKSWKSNHE